MRSTATGARRGDAQHINSASLARVQLTECALLSQRACRCVHAAAERWTERVQHDAAGGVLGRTVNSSMRRKSKKPQLQKSAASS
jgi:hypothetical protein